LENAPLKTSSYMEQKQGCLNAITPYLAWRIIALLYFRSACNTKGTMGIPEGNPRFV
jgi:hypothetical protein